MKRTLPTPVEYIVLSGDSFEEAICGSWGEGAHTRPWLASPRLKYYTRRYALERGPDQRMFFMAVTPPQYDESTDREVKRAIGIIELQVSPYDNQEVWLKYITVDPEYRLRGVCKKLLDLMVAYVRAHPRLLARSRAGAESPAALQVYIDGLLDRSGIEWTQTGRKGKSLAVV